MESKIKRETPEQREFYNHGYKAGYRAGYNKGRNDTKVSESKKAYLYVKRYDWYCSNCHTKHEQAHSDFCCKCGAEMSEEARTYEDN